MPENNKGDSHCVNERCRGETLLATEANENGNSTHIAFDNFSTRLNLISNLAAYEDLIALWPSFEPIPDITFPNPDLQYGKKSAPPTSMPANAVLDRKFLHKDPDGSQFCSNSR